MEDYAERMQRCRDYVEALEEERRKIQVFHRELPLCFELVTQAIDACRQQLGTVAAVYFPGRSECSEQTSSEERPVLEEFIPIKRISSSSEEGEEEEEEAEHKLKSKDKNDKPLKKSDWLRSVHLWHTDPDPPHEQEQTERKVSVRGAFQPFQKLNKVVIATPPVVATIPSSGQTGTASSTTTTINDTAAANGGSSEKKEEKEGESNRKPRRSWSPELHRRFLHSLQQLGGSHAATPKQIRELMKVDGLTNDEVKSHLQKYRLHTRRSSPAATSNGDNLQQPQFVVMRGVWVPPPEYAAVATKGETNGVAANGIYVPVAAPAHPPLPMTVKQSQRSPSHSEDTGCRSGDEKGHSNSPTSSSSTRTTTASPAF